MKDAIFNKLFDYLMAHRGDDVIRAVNGMSSHINRQKRSEGLLKWYMNKVGKLEPLTDEQLAEVKKTWKDIWDTGVVKPEWVQMYTSKTGKFDPAYVGSDLHYYYTEWNKIDFDYLRAFLDKNYMDIVLPCIKHPPTLLRKVHGHYYDVDFNPITEDDAVEILWQNRDPGAVVKIARVSCGGAGVTFVSKESSREQMRDALRINADMAVQLVIRQHPAMAEMNESSVNTVRITCMMIDGESVNVSTCMRIGNSGSRVDNFSSGGVACGVQPDGSLTEFGYDAKGNRYSVHPNGFVFKGHKVPYYDKALEAVKRCHYRVPMFGVVSWDVAIDENGEPLLIEYNVAGSSIDLHQYNNGPIYGKYREKIIDEVFKNYCVRSATLDYDYSVKRDGVEITKGGTGMKTCTIPAYIKDKKVVRIGRSAFSGNAKLESINVEAALKSIEYSAFYGCEQLHSVSLSGGVEVIGRSAFNDCEELVSFKVPEGCKTICTMAFRKCPKLEKLYIPASVETIEKSILMESPNALIYCKKGSAAHKYAEAHGIKFKLN